jgi:hypothetical protein
MSEERHVISPALRPDRRTGKYGRDMYIDDWLVEQGEERGHGFTIASFHTEAAARAFLDKFENLQVIDWHVISVREVAAIREREAAARRSTP